MNPQTVIYSVDDLAIAMWKDLHAKKIANKGDTGKYQLQKDEYEDIIGMRMIITKPGEQENSEEKSLDNPNET